MNRHLDNQAYLGDLFTATGNAMAKTLDALPSVPDCEKGFRIFAKTLGGEHAPTKHQQGIQARVIEYLKQHGGIDALTVQKLGTTDARKIFSRLRDKGYLFPADDPVGHEERPNASGQGTYRWHRWTGKQ